MLISRLLNRSRDLLFVPGMEKFWLGRLLGQVTVMVYHRVEEANPPAWLDLGRVPRITPKELAAELQFMQALGAVFLTFNDLRAGRFPGKNEFGIVVSFDDGFLDSYEQGLPVVEAAGGRAVVFQCTAMLARDSLLPEHRVYRVLYSGSPEQQERQRAAFASLLGMDAGHGYAMENLKEAALMRVSRDRLLVILEELEQEEEVGIDSIYPSPGILRKAVAAGHEIGSHGHWHSHRSTLSDAQFELELSESSSLIEQATGVRPAAFSYPFGAYAQGDREICAKYFNQAVTCDRVRIGRQADPLALGRFSWPGPPSPKGLRRQRWLLSGTA